MLAQLVPKLLAWAFITVVDLMIYGDIAEKASQLLLRKEISATFQKLVGQEGGNSPGLYFQRSKF